MLVSGVQQSDLVTHCIDLFFFYFFIIFFSLYNIVLVLPYINMDLFFFRFLSHIRLSQSTEQSSL